MKCIHKNTNIRIKLKDALSEPIHTNKAVRQGCDLSPVLFNIYINEIIQKIQTIIKHGMNLTKSKLVITILYAGQQIVMATSEDDLQTTECHLNLIARKYKMTTSSTKQNQWQCVGTTYRGEICDKRQYY